MHALLGAAETVLAFAPNPSPQAPPGAEAITRILGYVKWIAGAALIVGFFGGLAVFAGGRMVDHHRFGRMGAITMMASLGGAILYAVGYTLISSFAGG
ncbi:hypothetical protein ACVGVM_29055 (plasmid) [Pseudonocardia bannensis]|uniref:TrbC/VIRB2 family protein n=1 Tax=Pseudonocardia bannensis TaxID=630973 RepID=A0A848DPL1_9PSEU|nr:hypothetical protein [Pseudonocardia bannensis]NMH94449.1 hypothetical protein [Pseudonocardia bannensis]